MPWKRYTWADFGEESYPWTDPKEPPNPPCDPDFAWMEEEHGVRVYEDDGRPDETEKLAAMGITFSEEDMRAAGFDTVDFEELIFTILRHAWRRHPRGARVIFNPAPSGSIAIEIYD